MIPPISSKMHGSTGAAPLNEAVVRFGATQEMREQQRVERATEESEVSPPRDETRIEATAEDIAPSPEGAGGGAPTQTRGAEARNRAESASLGERQAESEGMREQQEQAIAQHAAEQHGKREGVRGEGDRQTRSTREMMGRVESHTKTTGTKGPEKPASREGAAVSSPSRGASHAASTRGAGSGRESVGPAPSRPAAHAPRAGSRGAVGGDIMAAAVGSGAATAEEVAPGTAQARDRDDDNAQDVESSREGVSLRADDTRKQVSRERSLDGHAGFHDGEGGRQDTHPRFGEQRRGGAGSGAQSQSGDRSDDRARRSPDEREAGDRVASAPAADEPAASPSLSADSVPASTIVASPPPASAPEAPPSPPPSVAIAGTDAVASSKEDAPRHDARDGVTVSGAPASASSSLGLGLGDEYFFFDDARPQVEAPAADAAP